MILIYEILQVGEIINDLTAWLGWVHMYYIVSENLDIKIDIEKLMNIDYFNSNVKGERRVCTVAKNLARIQSEWPEQNCPGMGCLYAFIFDSSWRAGSWWKNRENARYYFN